VTSVRRPRPPASLGEAGRRFWRSVVAAYELSPGEVELLRQVVRLVDVIDRLDVVLIDDELTVRGSTGQPRAHPLLAASAEQRRTLDALIQALGLPMPDEVEGRRRSPVAVAAAQARWREQRRRHG
jgi:hypothetical protein